MPWGIFDQFSDPDGNLTGRKCGLRSTGLALFRKNHLSPTPPKKPKGRSNRLGLSFITGCFRTQFSYVTPDMRSCQDTHNSLKQHGLLKMILAEALYRASSFAGEAIGNSLPQVLCLRHKLLGPRFLQPFQRPAGVLLHKRVPVLR